MKKFIPDSPHERHQKYFDAFLIEEGLTDSKYLNYITQYIFDPNISSSNSDDMDFFKDLLFESIKGKVHINYYDWIVTHWLKYAFPQSITTLSKYAEFLGKLSTMFLEDFFNYLLKLPNKEIIVSVFQKLSTDNKIKFIGWADHHPEIVKLIPKLRLYLLFS
jgi:hypothetical protein